MNTRCAGLLVALFTATLLPASAVAQDSAEPDDSESVEAPESDAEASSAESESDAEASSTESESDTEASSAESESDAEASGAETDTGEEASGGEGGVAETVSLTLSLFNLAKPLLSSGDITFTPEYEVLAEFNIADIFGVAGLLNYGRGTIHLQGDEVDMNNLKFAVQGNWYPIGNFGDGMQLGLEVMHNRVFGSGDINQVDVQAAANATSVAGLIGYKLIAGPGFTFNGQLGGGPRFLAARADASQGDADASASQSGVVPKIILNVNLGWSF